MEITLSVIKADTGGYVGHSAVHPQMVELARERVQGAVASGLLIAAQVSHVGDDLALIMSHARGPGDSMVHGLAWDVFQATTSVARDLGLYGAGQDLLSDAFS